MKIGIMTDIHNNRRALEEVLTVFEAEHCEQILCAGDIIGIGPEPEETVQRLMALPNLLAVLREPRNLFVGGNAFCLA